MKNTIKIARYIGQVPVYDCHVFAVDGSSIVGKDFIFHVNITGDFIGGDKIHIDGNVCADGIVCIGKNCKANHILAGEGVFLDNYADTYDLISPEDIEVGDNANLWEVRSYGNIKMGCNVVAGNVEVLNGSFELGSGGHAVIVVGKT